MDKNQLLMLAAVIFGIIALLHLLRSIFSWEANIGGFDVPVWYSYVAVVVTGYLSWQMYSTAQERSKDI
ncbi:hypothetical protein HYT53_02035 [Candidatus Woesearchaeota archaeon]|nr:hypothetical protein [Candidatus Woesearchaeota archaeon]